MQLLSLILILIAIMSKINQTKNPSHNKYNDIVGIEGRQSHQIYDGGTCPPFYLRVIMVLPVGPLVPILAVPTMQAVGVLSPHRSTTMSSLTPLSLAKDMPPAPSACNIMRCDSGEGSTDCCALGSATIFNNLPPKSRSKLVKNNTLGS